MARARTCSCSELVVAGWYDLLTLFRTIAEQRCIVAHQDNDGDALAELRQDLLDEPRVGLVKADVDAGKRFATRRELPPFGEFALRIWVRQLQGVLMPRPQFALSGSLVRLLLRDCLERRD